MTLYQYNFEGGTNGAALAAGQTGSGDPLSVVAPTNGTTMVYDSTRAAHGTKSLLITPSSTGQGRFDYTVSSSAVAARIYVYLTALPTSDMYLLRFDVNSTRTVSLHLNSAGKLRLSDASGTTGVWTAAATFPLNQWVRIGLYAKPGTSTTTGTLSAGTYLGDSTTPVEAVYSTSTANCGTAAFTSVGMGKINAASTYATAFSVDDAAVDDSASGLVGPYVAANVAPSANAGADQANVEPGATVTLAGVGSDSDGTVASYAWAQTGGTSVTLSGSGASRTFTAPGTLNGDTLTFQLTVTDNLGAASTDTVVVSVLSATEFARSAGAWVPRRTVRRSVGAWV